MRLQAFVEAEHRSLPNESITYLADVPRIDATQIDRHAIGQACLQVHHRGCAVVSPL